MVSLPVSIDHNCSIERVSESSVIIRAKMNAVDKENSHLSSLQARNESVKKWLTSIEKHLPNWLIDCVIAYDSLLLEFDPMQIEFEGLTRWLRDIDLEFRSTIKTNEAIENGQLHQVEVCYEYCAKHHPNDMSLVEQYTGLSAGEIVHLHQSINYQVFAIGFMPHFAYLGELPLALSVPRLKAPRLKVPAGAVAIADKQTAIYPNESPGGWHIIGYTNFSFSGGVRGVICPNDKVSFKATSLNTFLQETKGSSEPYG